MSRRVKNKEKLLVLLEKKGTNSKRQKLWSGDFKKVDKAVYTWLISKRSKQIAIDDVILTEKALEFTKALGETGFKASDCWLSNWEKR